MEVTYFGDKSRPLAIKISDWTKPMKELEFPTNQNLPLQVGVHSRKAGLKIRAHRHSDIKEELLRVGEIFYIDSGQVKIKIYDGDRFFDQVIVNPREIICLFCGHAFEFLKDTKMFEVRQGPHSADNKIFIGDEK